MKKIFLLTSLFLAFSKLQSAEAFLDGLETYAQELRQEVEGTINLSFGNDVTSYSYSLPLLTQFKTINDMMESFELISNARNDEVVPLSNIPSKEAFDAIVDYLQSIREGRKDFLKRYTTADKILQILEGISYLDYCPEDIRNMAKQTKEEKEAKSIKEKQLQINIFEPFFDLLGGNTPVAEQLRNIMLPKDKVAQTRVHERFRFFFKSEAFAHLGTHHLCDRYREELSRLNIPSNQLPFKEFIIQVNKDANHNNDPFTKRMIEHLKRSYEEHNLNLLIDNNFGQKKIARVPLGSKCITEVVDSGWKNIIQTLSTKAPEAEQHFLCLENNLLRTFFLPPGLSTLTHLDLSQNFLEKLPHGLANLPALIFLNLAYNHLSELPNNAFADLPNLRSLVLKNNNFAGGLPDDVFTGLPQLEILSLAYCELEKLPASVRLLATLKRLDTSSNQLDPLSLSSDFFDFASSNLTFLDVSSCNLNQLPGTDTEVVFGELDFLEISDNNLRNLGCTPPEFAKRFPKLSGIYIGLNSLDVLKKGETVDQKKADLNEFLKPYIEATREDRKQRGQRKPSSVRVGCPVSHERRTHSMDPYPRD